MRYDERNEAAIEKLDPAFQPKVRQLLQTEEANGRDLLIASGFRTGDEQNAKFQIGRDERGKVIGPVVTNARAGESTHCYGCAVDLVPIAENGAPEWGDTETLRAVAVDAKRLGLAWGGDWTTFKGDYGHFEFTGGLTLAQLQAGIRPALPRTNVTTADLQHELKVAEGAVDKPWIKSLRKFGLTNAIRRLKKRLGLA